MTTSTTKKGSGTKPKVASARAKQTSDTKCNVRPDDYDDRVMHEKAALPPPSQISKSSTGVKILPRSIPTDDVLELTSEDDEEGGVISDSNTFRSNSDNGVSDEEAAVVIEDVKALKAKAVRTRSSNGISKKRHLKDAAIFSDDDEFPLTITPKKSRVVGDILDFGSPYEENDKLTDTAFADNDESGLSLSPLKLGAINQHSHDRDNDTIDPFVAEPVLKKGIVLKISKSAGKKKAAVLSAVEPVEEDNSTSDGDLHSEEMLNIARAMFQSAKEQRLRDQRYSGASSSIATRLSTRIGRIEDKAIDANPSAAFSDGSDAPRTPSNMAVNPGNIASPVGSPAPTTRRTFKDVFPQPKTTSIMSKSPLYQADLMQYRVSALPAVCQVTDPDIQDEFLASDYSSLPHLVAGSLISWSTTPVEMAQVNFSGWLLQCPDLPFDITLAAVRFGRYKNFINPSRISPLDVNIHYTTHDRKRSVLQCNMRTAICLSTILTERESFLVEPTVYGLKNKYIAGHFHSQEWQRFEGFVTMVFDKPVMTAQLYNKAISFATMGAAKADRDTSYPSKGPRNSAIFSSKSRSNAAGEQPRKIIADTSFKSVLDYNDDVPIYDARQADFNFGSDLEDIASVLPRFHREIPANACVVVGYSMAHYMKDNKAHLSTNVLFAILLGTEYPV